MTVGLHIDHWPDGGVWTIDDLAALPEDGRRRELLDGSLLLHPSPTTSHQKLTARLAVALEEHCPDEYDVTQGVAIGISPTRSFVPDVLVTTMAAAERNPSLYAPHEVLLAVEIVSPSSRSMDRMVKPTMYAEAGIPHYWRIETEDDALVVYAHRLDPSGGAYTQTGRWVEVVDVEEPFPVKLAVGRLVPR
jgi:Uma2 family endonuclease